IQNYVWNSNGYIQGDLIGNDPFVKSPVIDIPINEDVIIKIRLKVDANRTNAQMYFTTYAEPSYGESKKQSFNLVADKEGFYNYYIDMSENPLWTGRLRSLRLDPVHGTNSGSFAVD